MKKEILPDIPVIKAVIEQVLTPTIKQFEKELGESLPACLAVLCGEIHVYDCKLIHKQEDSKIKGEIHLFFRETYGGDQIRFFCESIFSNISNQSGFSGFKVKGNINKHTLHLKRTGFTIQYNVFEWKGWI